MATLCQRHKSVKRAPLTVAIHSCTQWKRLPALKNERPLHNVLPPSLDGFVEAHASRVFRDGSGTIPFVPISPELGIKPLEVNDSIFEFVFPKYLGEDGSGEKGFETLDQNFYFPCRKGTPRHSRCIESVTDTSLCPGKQKLFFE
jgi:hypothetical protein